MAEVHSLLPGLAPTAQQSCRLLLAPTPCYVGCGRWLYSSCAGSIKGYRLLLPTAQGALGNQGHAMDGPDLIAGTRV